MFGLFGSSEGRKFSDEIADHLNIDRALFNSALLETGVTNSKLKKLKRSEITLEQATSELMPNLVRGLSVINDKFGPQPMISDAVAVIQHWVDTNEPSEDTPNISTEINADLPIEDQAYSYGAKVLSEIGVIQALAEMQLLGLSNPDAKEDIRGLVIGGYMTAGIGASLVVRFMLTNNASKESTNKAYWHFYTESAVRQIATDLYISLWTDGDPPAGIVKQEADLLWKASGEISALHAAGQTSEAFEVWRETMKTGLQNISPEPTQI